jgi:hypothetical protein
VSKAFEIARQQESAATPQQVWDAFTTGTAAWLWPMEFEPVVGGAAAFGGVVTVWDPPRHFVTRSDGEDGWFNQLEQEVQGDPAGPARWRYVHSGVFVEDWDNQYDGAEQHTDFYLHTLQQYLTYFTDRPATFAGADGPPASAKPAGFSAVRTALGLDVDTRQDDAISFEVSGLGPIDGVIDYLTPNFIGVRTVDAMYRFFGRNAFGAPVGISIHHFAPGVNGDATGERWQAWLDSLYA